MAFWMFHCLQRANWKSLSLATLGGQQVTRCVSSSVSCLMKRPVFEGPEYPKKPLSPYMLFLSDKRATLPTTGESTPVDNVKKVAEMWRKLSISDKQIYQDRYDQLKKEHILEVERFLERVGNKDEQKKYLAKLTKYRCKRREYIKHYRLKRQGIVKPGSLSGYNVFMRENRNEFMQGNDPQYLKDGMRALSEKWRNLNEEEKKSFTEKAKVISAKRMADYLEKYKAGIESGSIKPPKEKEPRKVKKKTAVKKALSMGMLTQSREKPAPVKSVRKTSSVG